jgi:DNA/RNA-binding domain of Phe-tRNA-synthetase-like protein
MKEYNLLIDKNLQIGLIEANNIRVTESQSSFKEEVNSILKSIDENYINENIKASVRDMLRNGKYKPTGRGKPASEYLINSIIKNMEFPFINNIVDINNYISILSQLPISTFNSDVCKYPISIRYGKADESYIFNKSNQEIQLQDLLLTADTETALGNPVKDSMKSKVFEGTKNIFAVIYSTKETLIHEDLQKHLENFKRLLEKYAFAESVEYQILV